MNRLPTDEDVGAALRRLSGHTHKTPVLSSSMLNAEMEAQVFFKCESFQRMGAFNFRGALNALARLAPEQKRAGVVAFLSRNPPQAVALSAREPGIPPTILVPRDAPAKHGRARWE